ncbi:hypothetical protein Pcinc_014138 [Petrolisthes cinctipes]|uniref:Transposase n=1 Tax=Petrolisthes cinctipes TaxID=88211 RepID=A0AAE1G100_PETCI|nr:hypothetical protein Pcinc_014138 [Petrolisthes cinctipes]
MEVRPRGRARPARTRADRPEVIMRRTLIVGYHAAGKGIREISQLMGISRATVRLWLRRYEAEGHVLTRPRPGRPRVTTNEDDERLRRAVERNPQMTAVTLTREAELPCHVVTTRRRLWEAGLRCHIPARKEMLTEANKQSRLRFAQTYVNVGADIWKSVIFSDEKCFSSVSAQGRQCWRLRDTRFSAINIAQRSRSGRVSVSVHGWMWWGGPGELVTIEGNLDSQQYINILETSFLPSVRAYAIPEPKPIYFVQDRSPIHTSRAVSNWFWALMVQEWEVEQKTKEAVERKTREVWELVESVPRRLQDVIEAEGGWTRY